MPNTGLSTLHVPSPFPSRPEVKDSGWGWSQQRKERSGYIESGGGAQVPSSQDPDVGPRKGGSLGSSSKGSALPGRSQGRRVDIVTL